MKKSTLSSRIFAVLFLLAGFAFAPAAISAEETKVEEVAGKAVETAEKAMDTTEKAADADKKKKKKKGDEPDCE